MKDEETGDIINRAVTALLPEIIRVVWNEMKDINGYQIEDVSNHHFLQQ